MRILVDAQFGRTLVSASAALARMEFRRWRVWMTPANSLSRKPERTSINSNLKISDREELSVGGPADSEAAWRPVHPGGGAGGQEQQPGRCVNMSHPARRILRAPVSNFRQNRFDNKDLAARFRWSFDQNLLIPPAL
jgi:hypothetical protein